MKKTALSKFKKIYFIGIKGSGMASLAIFLKNQGRDVSGSDTKEKFFTDELLKKNKIGFKEKFVAENVPSDADAVVYSTAYNESNNVEYQEALNKKMNLISYPEMLGIVFNHQFGIVVCGTHGKTTTSAWLAYVLEKCGKDPSAIIGSRVTGWQSNARVGTGDIFVIEADEYQNKLRFYDPAASILTSIDWDHPDFFPTPEEYKKVFSDFAARIPKHGFLVAWGDSRDVLDAIRSAKCEVITYGFLEENNIFIQNLEAGIVEDGKYYQKFDLIYKNQGQGQFQIQLLGKHNILNAAAVIGVCLKLNISLEEIKNAVQEFQGTARRFEYVGMRNGAVLIDDYGHHPEEIRATLSGARERYPEKNIIAVFHPHSFTRTEALLSEFSQSFDEADEVIVLDIYGSARETRGNVSSKDLVELINKYSPRKAEHIATIEDAVENLKDRLDADDLVLAIGAGNVWEVAKKLRAD